MSRERRSTMPPAPAESIGAVETMARSMTHEMNNVLASIMGLASLLEAEIEPESPHHHDIREIVAGCRKGLTLTKSFLGFFGSQPRQMARLDLNLLVGKARSLVLRSTAADVEIEMQLAEDLPNIEGDPMLIKQTLIQLGLNAVEAIPKRGTVTMTTRDVTLSAAEAEAAGLTAGRYVRFQIFDTGVGMDGPTLEHAFEPLFSTKRHGTAAGLGLPIVARIVGEHGGAVSLYSRPGFGTTVTCYFPALDPSRISGEWGTAESEPPPLPRPRCALLVDDEVLPRSASKRLLKKLGYQVHDAGSGAEALALYEQSRDEIDLVLLDLIMPDMDGVEVVGRLKQLDPEVCIVVYTGYPMESPMERLGVAGFVRKPFTMQQLRDALEGALGDRRTAADPP